MKRKYIFTFGSDHPYAGRYVLIYAETMHDAREVMFTVHGSQWCGCYTPEDMIQNPYKLLAIIGEE